MGSANGNGTVTDAWANRIVATGEAAPGELLPNPRNWRTHPEHQRKALGAVLAEVGWVQQVIVNRTTGHLVDGHLRVALALEQREPLVPVVYVELTAGDEALVLATLDPIAALAERNEEMLREVLSDVSVMDAELKAMLDGMVVDAPTEVTEDTVPAVPEDPTTKPGDLWLLDGHRLLCGDSTDAADVERLIGEAQFALLATDPPYGVDYAAVVQGRKNQKRGGWKGIEHDELGEGGATLMGQALRLARTRAQAGAAVLVWHPSGENASAFRAALVDAGVHVLKQIIWVKPVLVFGRHEYHWRHENAMYGWFEGSRANFYGERSETTVWEVAPSPSSDVRNGPAMATGGLGEHPTQKPVELSARAIRNHTLPGEATYEPFAGSGSALIASEQLTRRCLAMEIDPAYCDVIVKRWENLTGETAVLDGG